MFNEPNFGETPTKGRKHESTAVFGYTAEIADDRRPRLLCAHAKRPPDDIFLSYRAQLFGRRPWPPIEFHRLLFGALNAAPSKKPMLTPTNTPTTKQVTRRPPRPLSIVLVIKSVGRQIKVFSFTFRVRDADGGAFRTERNPQSGEFGFIERPLQISDGDFQFMVHAGNGRRRRTSQ